MVRSNARKTFKEGLLGNVDEEEKSNWYRRRKSSQNLFYKYKLKPYRLLRVK